MGIFGFALFLLIVIVIILSFATIEKAGRFLLVNFIIASIYISVILTWHYLDPNNDNYRGIGTAIYGFLAICSHTFFMIFYLLAKGVEASGKIKRMNEKNGGHFEPSINDFKESLIMSLSRVKVSEILISHYHLNQPLTNVEIMNLSKLKSSKPIIDFLKELEILELLENKRTKNSASWKLSKQGESLLKEMIRVL